jgi:hypothetical protein
MAEVRRGDYNQQIQNTHKTAVYSDFSAYSYHISILPLSSAPSGPPSLIGQLTVCTYTFRCIFLFFQQLVL